MAISYKVAIDAHLCVNVVVDDESVDTSSEDMREMVLSNVQDQMRNLSIEDLHFIVDDYIVVEKTEI